MSSNIGHYPHRPMPLSAFSYDRTWDEIEAMLTLAEERKADWKQCYDLCRIESDRAGMKDAARNFKALEGVEKTLRWVLGQKGVENPLD